MAPNLIGKTSYDQLIHTGSEIDNRTNEAHVKSRETTTIANHDKVNTDEKMKIVWINVLKFIFIHSIAFYGLYLFFTGKISWGGILIIYLNAMFGGFGITAGAHRLWAHRSYKAKLPLRVFLMLAQSAALQNDIHEWVRDHRVHHKFTDTDADPHNASRGFFFSHMGWLMVKKHKDVLVKGKSIDMSDVLADPVVRFQIKYYIPLILLTNVTIPTLLFHYAFELNIFDAFAVSMARYVLSLHGTWLVNSAAHIWGMKPYDKNIKPSENKLVSAIAFGEGFHNYHHVFPWDYKTAELGNYGYNFTTCFLDLMAKIGQATDLKTASDEVIRLRALRTGDLSWNEEEGQTKMTDHHHHHGEDLIWGWGDKDMSKDEMKAVTRINRQKA